MSQTIDDRIVQLEFDNDDFEKGVAASIKTLEKLKESLKMDDAAKNLSSLSKVADKVDLSGIEKAMDSMETKISKKLKGWKLSLFSAVGNLFSGLIVDPLKQAISGGIQRAQNIADAKFKLEGLGVSWQAVSEDIDYAVQDTAYGMDAAANAAAQFAASGLKTGDEMKTALRAISGIASMSSSTYEEITPIFTKAAGSGRVMADELNRIAAKGLNASAELAKYFNGINEGTIIVDEAVEKQVKTITQGMRVSEADIREFASDSKISFKMFYEAMDSAFGEHAKESNKTFTGSLANMKAALSRIGQGLREPIMDEAIPAFNSLRLMINSIKKALTSSGIYDIWARLVTAASGKIVGFVDSVTAKINGNLKALESVGSGLKNLLYSIIMIVKTVSSAFREVFGDGSNSITKSFDETAKSFEETTQSMIPTEEGLLRLKRVITGVLNIFKKLKEGIESVVDAISPITSTIFRVLLVSAVSLVSNLLLIIKALKDISSKSTSIGDFFIKLKNVIFSLIPGLGNVRSGLSVISPVIDKIIDKVTKFAGIVKNVLLGTFAVAVIGIYTAFNKLSQISLSGVINSIRTLITNIKSIPQISEAVNNIKIIFANIGTFFGRLLNSIVEFFASFRGQSRETTRSVVSDMSLLERIIYSVTTVFKGLGTVIGAIALGALTLFNKAFNAIRNFSLERTISNIKNFIASVRELGLLKTLSNTFSNVGGIIGDVLMKIIRKFEDLQARIKASGGIIDFLIEKLFTLGEKLSLIKESLTSTLSGDDEFTRAGMGGSNNLISTIDILKDKLLSLKATVGNVLQYIRDKGYLTKALMIAWLVAVMKALLNFSSGTKTIANAMSEGTGIFKAFTGFGNLMDSLASTINFAKNPMGALTEALRGWNEAYIEAHKKSPAENFAAMMKSMAIGVGVLAASLAVLYKVVDDVDKFKQIATGMGIFVGVMIAVAGAMTILSAKMSTVDNSFYSSFAANMIGIALAIGVLAKSVRILSEIEAPKLAKGIGALVAIELLYAGLQFLLSRINKVGMGLVVQLKGLVKMGLKIATAAASFVMLAAGLGLMTLAIKGLINLHLASDTAALEDLIFGITILGSIFVAVIVASKYCAGATKGVLQISGALALLGFAATQIVATALIMKLIKWPDDLAKMGIVFAGLAVIFAGIAFVAGKVGGATKGMVGIGLAFTLLANTLFKIIIAAKLMEHIDMDMLTLSLTTLLAVVGMLSLVLVAAGTIKNGNAWKPIVAALAGVALIFGLLITMSLMVSNPTVFFDILKATGIITLILLAYAQVLKGAGKINSSKGAARILAMLAGLGVIIGGLYILMPLVKDTGDFIKLVGIAAVIELALFALIKMTESFLKFAKDNKLGNGKWLTKALTVLLAMVLAFAAVAAVLVITSKSAKWYELVAIAAALSAAILALTFAAKVIIENTKRVKWEQLGKVAVMLGIMVAAVAAIGLVIAGLNKIAPNAGTSLGNALAVTLVLGALVGLTILLGKFSTMAKKATKALPALLAMTGIFMAIGLIIAGLNVISPDAKQTLFNSQVVALVLAELIGMTILIGSFKTTAAKALAALPALLAMTGVYVVVGLVIAALNLVSKDAKQSLKNSQVVALVLVELIALTTLIGALATIAAVAIVAMPALAGMVALYALVGLVVGGLALLVKDSSKALKNSQIVSLVLVELIALSALLGVLSPVAAAAVLAMPALVLLTAVFGIVGLIISVIGQMNFGEDINTKLETLKSVLWSLVGVVAVLGLLSVGAIGEVAGAAAILMIAEALIPLANGLNALGSVPYDTVANGLKYIAAGLVILIAAGIAGTIAGAGFVVLSVGIAAVGVACIIAAAGVTLLATALNIIVEAVAAFSVSIIESAQNAVEGFKEKLEKFKELPGEIIDALIRALGDAIEDLKAAGKAMGDALVESFRDSVGWHSPPQFIVNFFRDTGVAVNQNAKGITDLFEGTGNDWGTALETALGNKMNDLSNFDLGSIGDLLGSDLGNGLFNGAMPGINGVEDALAQLGWGVNNVEVQIAQLNAKMRDGSISTGDYVYQMKKLTESSKKSKSSTDDLTAALTNFSGAAKGAGSSTKDFGESLEQTLSSQMNIFQKFEAKSAMSKEELLNNMRSQIDGMANWAAQMQQLATMGIDKGLYQKLAEMGPQGAEYVGAFASMTAEEMAAANEMWAQSLVLPGQTASMIKGSWTNISTEMVNGLSKGWAGSAGEFHDTAMATSTDLQDDWKSENGIHSPSTVYYDFGKNMVIGLAEGIKDFSYKPIAALKLLGVKMMNAAKEGMNPADYAKLGSGVVDGLVSGMESNLDKVRTAATALSDAAKSVKSKENLDINSPSKAFIKIGKSVDEGFAKGISNNTDMVANSVSDMSDETIEAMKYTIANIAAMVNDEIENPVITPILDLSNVRAGARTLNSVLSTNRALKASGSLETDLQNEQGQIGGTTFIQNNYSPKALSRADIYRQTRNQFAQYKAQMG